jgi:hypothetical protein
MIARPRAVHAKIGGQATLGDRVGLNGLEEVLKDPVRLARLQATRPSPPWANQSEAEHDADIAGAWRSRTMSNRRILQGVEEDGDGAIMQLLPGPTAWCNDPLATNGGDGGSCAYECEVLQRYYFLAEESRCFLYDTFTRSWPEALLVRKQAVSNSNNTIVVPNHENWVIQGALGPDGLPLKLDARLSSGSAVDFSEASIVVRHVRVSGQIAPQDLNKAARHYNGWMGDLFGGGFALGGAFSYDGGGLEPDVRTPQLIFEHVVFDRNRAVVGSAVWIAGRQGTMSGLKLVVDGCLFFRNVASFFATLTALSSCPSTLLVNNTDFIHNEAFANSALWFNDLGLKVGVVGQRHSWMVANSHFEGPTRTYNVRGPMFMMDTIDDSRWIPDGTIHDGLMEWVTVIDGQSDTGSLAIQRVSTGARALNCRLHGCRVARVTGADSGLYLQSIEHSQAITFDGANYSEVSHLTIEDSGAFQDDSRGGGVLAFSDKNVMFVEHESTNEYHVLDSTFARNKAARGAAIGWYSTTARLVVQRCFFQVCFGQPLGALSLPFMSSLNVLCVTIVCRTMWPQ